MAENCALRDAAPVWPDKGHVAGFTEDHEVAEAKLAVAVAAAFHFSSVSACSMRECCPIHRYGPDRTELLNLFFILAFDQMVRGGTGRLGGVSSTTAAPCP